VCWSDSGPFESEDPWIDHGGAKTGPLHVISFFGILKVQLTASATVYLAVPSIFTRIWIMDAYPAEYTNHELPLILLSGLTDAPAPPRSSGPIIECSLPVVQSDSAKLLLQDFLALQGNDSEGDSRPSRSKNGLIGYKFKLAGRVGTCRAFWSRYRLITYRNISFLLVKQTRLAHSMYIGRILWLTMTQSQLLGPFIHRFPPCPPSLRYILMEFSLLLGLQNTRMRSLACSWLFLISRLIQGRIVFMTIN
jgi:hypothetical protein